MAYVQDGDYNKYQNHRHYGGIGIGTCNDDNDNDDDDDEGKYDIYEQDQDDSSFGINDAGDDANANADADGYDELFDPVAPASPHASTHAHSHNLSSGDYNDDETVNTGSGSSSGHLLEILEYAVSISQRNEKEVLALAAMVTPEELQQKRELLEQTWKEIRTDWLWANETREQRTTAVYVRGKNDLTPLHLICKLTNNPPTDIISEIIQAAPEVASWADAHSWLPLHHACINGASTEVLQLLTRAYPEGKAALDTNNRTPLHLYSTRGNSDNYNPVTLATNFTILVSGGTGNEIGDENDESSVRKGAGAAMVQTTMGMLPMHYACAYGTTTSVLKVLEKAYPKSLNAKDNNGRTPLHMAMVNAQRKSSPGVLGYLLNYDYDYYENSNNDAVCDSDNNNNNNMNNEKRVVRTICGVNVRDKEGNLPLHLLNIGLIGVDFEQNPEDFHNIAECLKLYLAAKPYASTDFLAALQSLPDSLQNVAVVSPHVRNILNKKIVQRFPTSILVSLSFFFFFYFRIR